ncbi:MAG: prepilin-type N-terminal cleavage/methylation domain-containing protein [Arenicella sp.]|jgi:prepilin-type N-terminal cleavage/methylation domain-containing protein
MIILTALKQINKYRQRQALATGFTLIELMLAVSVLAVVAASAAPSFKQFIERQSVRTQANNIQRALSSARSEALTQAAEVDICWNFETTAWAFPADTDIADIDGVAGAQVIAPNSIAIAINSDQDRLIDIIQIDDRTTLTSGDGNTRDCTAFSAQGFLAGGIAVTFNSSDDSGDNQLNIALTTSGRSVTREPDPDQ